MNKGREIVVCARVGGANTTPILAAHFAKQNTKFGDEKARAGREFLSPQPPFLFARPSGKVFCSAARSAAIKIRSPGFRQKKFGFRPANTTPLEVCVIFKLIVLLKS